MVEIVKYKRPRQIRVKEIERLKLENFVVDESGKRPVAISVVMPTFNKKNKEYNRTVANIINTLGNLIDNGVIDEVVIAEGSREEDGTPDSEFMEFLLATAISYCRTFEREVDFIRSMPEGKQKALQGRYDFSFRILNQVDEELHDIYLKHNILNEEEIEVLKHGKGANLWFSVPVTYGDIICFIDSDIISFRKHYIKGLCRPILLGWKSGSKMDEDRSSILFTKAAYIRQHKIHGGFKMGGRLSRLFGIPIFNILARQNIFNGLDSISYPFSGECAITRRALNELQFSNGYDIELSILCQLWKKYGIERIAQYDFGFFRHIPGDDKHVEDMLLEISMALFYWIKRYALEDRLGEIDHLLREYDKTATDMLDVYKKIAQEYPSRIRYGEEEIEKDMERISRYKEIIREGYNLSKTQKPKLLKPWSEIRKQMDSQAGYSYQTLKSTLQQRVNKFTSKILLSYIRIYVDRSSEIIAKFTE
ncbi:MAG: hypothetical protein DRO76_01955 [Candidatus Altiarchaeales archaeon]|nr:MAG: hypothetical protein DRO76_01955 [Candidatus Altiarchaeales archaeon]